jgi:biotin synthase
MQLSELVFLGERILAGHVITYTEAEQLTKVADADIVLLMAYANKIRQHYCGSKVDLCGILNARSGMCSEDCKFCSQSVYHQTASPVYPLQSAAALVSMAKQAQAGGARRISIVTSGKGMENDPDFADILVILKAIIIETGLQVCANLGTLSFSQAKQLAAIGIKRYAHNIETSERFYPEVCSTHPYSERMNTIAAARAAGLELCTGGIIGLGEGWQDRLAMAFALRELGVESVPVNILNPLPGTALEHLCPPPPLEILKTFALFRFILPSAVIRPAGGRELNLRDFQGSVMLSGANGLIVGNYLTFSGRDTAADLRMVTDAGLIPG